VRRRSRRCHPGLAQSRGRLPRQRILILTTFGLDDYIIAALRAGASGFLLKDAPSAQVIEAVRAVAAGAAVLSPTVTRQLLDQVGRRLPAAVSQAPDALNQLTGREREVVGILAAGLTNAEIARALSRSSRVPSGRCNGAASHRLTYSSTQRRQ